MENIYVIILEESDAWGEEKIEISRNYFISYEQARKLLLEDGYKEMNPNKISQYYSKYVGSHYFSATITKLSLYGVDD